MKYVVRIYQIHEDILVLELTRTGSQTALF